jgi:urease accessory protein
LTVKLLHLCDSLFPIGGFAHSEGLEAAAGAGRLHAVDVLQEWMDVVLDETIGRLEGPTVWQAWTAFHDCDWRALRRLDREVVALRPSSSARRSTRAMGLRLLTTWQALYPDPRNEHALSMARGGEIAPSLPVAFACASAGADVDRRTTVEAFAYTRLASTASAGMRLLPVGQTDAHVLLAHLLDRLPAVVDAMIARDAPAESFTPAMDIAAMTQQYLRSRLFKS